MAETLSGVAFQQPEFAESDVRHSRRTAPNTPQINWGRDWLLENSTVIDVYQQTVMAGLAREGDLIVAISVSGATRMLVHSVALAKSRGAKCVAITTDRRSKLARASDILLIDAGREIGPEAIASTVTVATVVEALYVALAVRDQKQTVSNERAIWEAMRLQSTSQTRREHDRGRSK